VLLIEKHHEQNSQKLTSSLQPLLADIIVGDVGRRCETASTQL
jgi:hypothetical protein